MEENCVGIVQLIHSGSPFDHLHTPQFHYLQFAKTSVGCVNAPIALAMLLDAAEPRGHSLDPVVAAPRTPRTYSEVGSSPERLGNASGYSAGPFDVLSGVGHYQVSTFGILTIIQAPNYESTELLLQLLGAGAVCLLLGPGLPSCRAC